MRAALLAAVLGTRRVAAALPSFALDRFTAAADQDIAAHVSDSGHSWIALLANTGGATVLAGTGQVRGNSTTGTTRQRLAVAPPSADYTVECDLAIASAASGTASMGPTGRNLSTASTCYEVTYNTTTINLARVNSGSSTSLATVTIPALAIGEVKRCRLRMDGARIRVTWGGEPLIDVVDPAPLVAAGFAGIRLRANARISNFVASA